jgi:hypothetical protein
MWSVFALTNQIPELKTGLIEIIYHLIGEFLTGIILIISGIGLFKQNKWSFHLFMVSLGMLFYTTIVSAGYYIDKSELSIVIMFSFLQILTFLFIIMGIVKHDRVEK